ncbi:hypothetical protein GCM10025734_03570 [Kitasatospora paranensis]
MTSPAVAAPAPLRRIVPDLGVEDLRDQDGVDLPVPDRREVGGARPRADLPGLPRFSQDIAEDGRLHGFAHRPSAGPGLVRHGRGGGRPPPGRVLVTHGGRRFVQRLPRPAVGDVSGKVYGGVREGPCADVFGWRVVVYAGGRLALPPVAVLVRVLGLRRWHLSTRAGESSEPVTGAAAPAPTRAR